jgi:hypothetical protein
MRMWMVDPRLLCRQHLLGEHVELHMLAASLRLRRSVLGFLVGRLIAPAAVGRRHAALSAEMARRGYNHRSPLAQPAWSGGGRVDRKANLRELARRCAGCRALQRRAR